MAKKRASGGRGGGGGGGALDAAAEASEAEERAEGASGADGAPAEAEAVEQAPPPAQTPEQLRHRALWTAWRAATDREAPTLNQLVQAGVKRVDVDAVAGYVAVATGEDTYRAIGVARELVVPLVATLCGRSDAEVEAALRGGPARIEAGGKSVTQGV